MNPLTPQREKGFPVKESNSRGLKLPKGRLKPLIRPSSQTTNFLS